jgi:hypothetical protein
MARVVAAIDFGTTYTTAAVRDTTGIGMIALDHHETRLPSLVLRARDAAGQPSWVVGRAATNQAALFPTAVERTPKRRIGTDDRLLLDNELLPVTEAVAAVLHHVWGVVQAQRPDVTDVVLTHPAGWPARRTDILVEASALAGIPQPVALCPEPVAAALAYAEHAPPAGELIAVYDLGGGTIDVAVLAAGPDGYHLVVPPGGDPNLGGEDFDERIFLHLCHQLELDDAGSVGKLMSSPEREWRLAADHLRLESRRAKEALSSAQSYSPYVPPPIARDLMLQEHELRALIAADIERSVDLLTAIIHMAEQSSGQRVTSVYLVGGSSRTPAVQHTIEARTGLPCITRENPKDVVARGGTLWRAADAYVAPPEPVELPSDAPIDSPLADLLEPEPTPSPATEVAPAEPTRPLENVSWTGALDGRLITVQSIGDHTVVSLFTQGTVSRQVSLTGTYAGAAVGSSAFVVVTVTGRRTDAYVLDSQLAVRTSASLGTVRPRWVRAIANRAWVIGDAGGRAPTSPHIGLPGGDVGNMAVWRIELDMLINSARQVIQVPSALWRINEGSSSFLLDPGSTTTAPPEVQEAPAGNGVLTWVVGHFDSRRAAVFARVRPHLDVRMKQLVVTDDGSAEPGIHAVFAPPWVHQVIWANDMCFSAGPAGIGRNGEARDVARPDLGAVRLIRTPFGMLTICVDRVLEDAGTTIGLLQPDGHQVLARSDRLPLRHPCFSDEPFEPFVSADSVVVPLRAGSGTVLLRVGADGTATEHGPFPGWWEPFAGADSGLLCRNTADLPPRPSSPPPERFDVALLRL